jgi:hypothetical protein
MLISKCSSELSGREPQKKIKSHDLRAKPRDLRFVSPTTNLKWKYRPPQIQKADGK